MVWGFLDSMHTIILGVTKHMWELFTKILTRSAKRIIDERLLRIQPPRDLRKLPLAMANHSILKAKDWKSWLLYYSIPVCLDLLSMENLEHYALFVKSMHILLQTSISNSELDQCEVNLLKFVAEFESLYGENSIAIMYILLSTPFNQLESQNLFGPHRLFHTKAIFLF